MNLKEHKEVYLLNCHMDIEYDSINGFSNGYGSSDGSGEKIWFCDTKVATGRGIDSGRGDGVGNGRGSGNNFDGIECLRIKGSPFAYGYGDGNGSGDVSGNWSGRYDGLGNRKSNVFYYAKIWGEWFEILNGIEDSLCLNIPEHHYNKIDKEFLQRVSNLESLRVLREKIGLEKYISLFDVKVINEETDHQGNKMKLYNYDEKGIKVTLLEVICPSTGRMYHLYPPDQGVKTCFDAKASTFGNKSLKYRHGDCGIIQVDHTFNYPMSES